jgi:hypothetical protein
VTISLEKQFKLIALLKYHQKGNIDKFFDFCDLSGYTDEYSHNLKRWNLYQAYNIAGIINSDGKTNQWYANECDTDIQINSHRPKKVYIHHQNPPHQKAIIQSEEGESLIHGEDNAQWGLQKQSSDFKLDIFSRIPSLNQIVFDYVKEDVQFPNSDSLVHNFEVEACEWIETEVGDLTNNSLVKFQLEYSGLRIYKLLFPLIRKSFTIYSNDWLFMVSRMLLNWEKHNFIEIEGSDLSFQTIFKIPLILQRILFANSRQVIIGSKTTYKGLDESILEKFIKYF